MAKAMPIGAQAMAEETVEFKHTLTSSSRTTSGVFDT